MGRRAGLALLLLALLPLYRLARQSFWYDELFTVWVARRPPAEILQQAAADGYTPPLYYLLVGALWRLGFQSENLRILSVIGGGIGLWSLMRLGQRLGGRPAAHTSLALGGLSPFLFSFSQELRPYTTLIGCAAAATEAFLAWWKKPRLPLALGWGALLLGAATSSYLGLLLLPVALALATRAPRRRQALPVVLGVIALSLFLALPGLERATGTIGIDTHYPFPLARLMLGHGVRMPPLAGDRDRGLTLATEITAGAVLLVAAALSWRRRDAALGAALGCLALSLGAAWVLDAVTGVGITTRYLALAFIPFMLVLALAVRQLGRAGPLLLAPIVLFQVIGLERYLFHQEYFRDDWRGLSRRLVETYERDDLVWGFPAHHLAVATSFYAPGVAVGGGFMGREGEPVYLLKPGERFSGYRLESQLERLLENPEEEIVRRATGRRVLLVTYADDDWHGDTRPLVRAIARERREKLERFPAREVLLLRVLDRP